MIDLLREGIRPMSEDDRTAWCWKVVNALESIHFDDLAVDLFAAKMKAKMAAARDKGRSGWDDPTQCSADVLKPMFLAHVEKGDPVDVANFCMMLDHYGASTKPVVAKCDLCDDTGSLDHAGFGMDPCWRCAAPKVASDTGAGLREDDYIKRIAALLLGSVNAPEQEIYRIAREIAALATPTDATALPTDVQRLVRAARVVAFEDEDPEAKQELVDASELFADRVPWEDEPDTDATDGATGGGEVPCDFWLGDCRRCGKRADRDNQLEPCARPRGPFAPLVEPWTNDAHALASELRRVANGWGEGFRIVQLLRDAADQIDTTATTPGGDLLEQAARVAEDEAEGARVLHNAAAQDRDRDGTNIHGEAWRVGKQIAARIRALKPAGDGGEA